MSVTLGALLLLAVAAIAANLPWLSNRFLFVIPLQAKSAWLRLLEWLLLYFVVGGLALGLEQRMMGGIHTQDWEFYAVTLSLFMVFALPGFIYRHDLRHHLDRAASRRR